MIDLFHYLMGPIDLSKASLEDFRLRFAGTLVTAGCFFLLIFGILDWQAGLKSVAIADAVLILVLSAAYWYLKTKDVMMGIRYCLAALFVWFVVTLPMTLLITLWLPFFPLAVFFCLGRKEGMWWSVVFLLTVAVEFSISRISGVFVADDLFLVSAVASLSLVVLTVLFYQRMLEIFEEAIQMQSQQLQQAQKMESVGLLAGGVAHDFNNLLVGVMGNVELGMMALDKNHPVQENLSSMMISAQRGADLVRQMLAFAGKGGWQSEHLKVNTLIEETSQLMGVGIAGKADLSYELAEGLPDVNVDITQIQQVLVNLMVNAADAASPGRHCQIVFRSGQKLCQKSDFDTCPINYTDHAGSYVYVQVIDNGCGIDEAVQARIFDPFFTTKEAGTGLGLAATAGVLRSLGGALSLKSEKGRGSEFTLWLPAVVGKRVKKTKSQPVEKKSTYRLKGTVLLADDEMLVRKVGKALLDKAGMKVLEAEDGQQALEMYHQHKDDIDLLILDYSMPKMNGAAIFDAVRKDRPDVPVIVSSGYADLDDINRMLQQGAHFVKKPFRVHELLSTAQKSLKQSDK